VLSAFGKTREFLMISMKSGLRVLSALRQREINPEQQITTRSSVPCEKRGDFQHLQDEAIHALGRGEVRDRRSEDRSQIEK